MNHSFARRPAARSRRIFFAKTVFATLARFFLSQTRTYVLYLHPARVSHAAGALVRSVRVQHVDDASKEILSDVRNSPIAFHVRREKDFFHGLKPRRVRRNEHELNTHQLEHRAQRTGRWTFALSITTKVLPLASMDGIT